MLLVLDERRGVRHSSEGLLQLSPGALAEWAVHPREQQYSDQARPVCSAPYGRVRPGV